jgi:hypothetical protein
MTKKLFARILLLAGLIVLLMLFAWEAFSEELSIIEVRSNIPLADTDPVYQDYYINSGTNEGLKHNLVVTATRKVAVRDATGTQSYGDMMVPVGQLKIIFVGEKFAIAREVKLLSRDEQPMIEQTGIMIGDKIDVKGSYVDNHKIPHKKIAEQKQEKPAETAATVTPVVAPAAAPAVAPSAEAPKEAAQVPDEVGKTAQTDESLD